MHFLIHQIKSNLVFFFIFVCLFFCLLFLLRLFVLFSFSLFYYLQMRLCYLKFDVFSTGIGCITFNIIISQQCSRIFIHQLNWIRYSIAQAESIPKTERRNGQIKHSFAINNKIQKQNQRNKTHSWGSPTTATKWIQNKTKFIIYSILMSNIYYMCTRFTRIINHNQNVLFSVWNPTN